MLTIENNTIYLTKGDDAVIDCIPTVDDGTEYPMQEDDCIVLTVREKPDKESAILLQFTSTHGSTRIAIRSEDTREINTGRYSADIQLNTGSGGHYTFWPKLSGVNRYTAYNFQNFIIMPEVTI